MDSELAALLAARAPAIGRGVEAALLAQDAPHYREAAPGVLGARCERLVAAFVEAARSGGPQPFERHARRIAEERVAEGFSLREVQLALSALEAGTWPLAVEAGGGTDAVVSRLALITGIIGRGKDELARAFLEQAERADALASRLQQRLDTLFKGTEPPPSV